MRKIIWCIVFIVYSPVQAFESHHSLPFGVEAQINLCQDFVSVHKALKLEDSEQERFSEYLFENNSLSLFSNNLTFRLRVKKKKNTLALKVGRLTTEGSAKLEALGAECEFDLHGSQRDLSCKVNQELDNETTQRLISGSLMLNEVIGTNQKESLEILNFSFPINPRIRPLGPILVIQFKDVLGSYVVDYNRLESGREFLEISIRASDSEADEVYRQMLMHLQNKMVKPCSQQSAQRKLKLLELLNKKNES